MNNEMTRNKIGLSGYGQVRSEALCIVTRMQFRRPWTILFAYRYYRRIVRNFRHVKGLLRTAFAVESPRVCLIFSIWENEDAIPRWDNQEHVAAVHWAFRHSVEIWSTEWQLNGISQRMDWGGETVAPVHEPKERLVW